MEKVIGALFETLAEPDWAGHFLAGVCAETRSHAAAVLQVDVATRRQTLPAYYGQGAEMALAFEQTHATGNPWRPPDESRGPPTGSVVVPDDLLPLARLRKTAFWTDFLRPMNVDHGGGVIGLRDAHQVISLTLLRSSRRGPYDARERSRLSLLSPHWTNACRLRGRLVPADAATGDAARAFDLMATAAFLLDERGQCVRWNAAADALLRDGTLVRLRGKRLIAPCPGAGPAFIQATGPTILRRKDGSVAGHAYFHDLPGHGALETARAVVFVDPLNVAAPEQLKRSLAIAYALTPREAELTSRLADGAELSQAAKAMGITPGAARTRLKTVYGKTGARHQAGLVALVRGLGAVLCSE
jgi:DNA-binding CsgD family transcriptional regulator